MVFLCVVCFVFCFFVFCLSFWFGGCVGVFCWCCFFLVGVFVVVCVWGGALFRVFCGGGVFFSAFLGGGGWNFRPFWGRGDIRPFCGGGEGEILVRFGVGVEFSPVLVSQ